MAAKKNSKPKPKVTAPDDVSDADKEAIKKALEEKALEEKELPSIENLDRKQFSKDKSIIFDDLPSGILIPKYFVNPSTDSSILRIERNEAEMWLIGPINVGTLKKPVRGSISGKVAYIGPRRFVSKQIKIASLSNSPNKNFWKVWQEAVRLWRNSEAPQIIKDTEFIQECFKSQNWQIRFIVDTPFSQGEAEGRLVKRNVQQWLGHPYRLRESAILLGQEIPLKAGEAATMLGKLKVKEITLADKKFEYILDYLQKKKKSDESTPTEEPEK